MFTNRGHRRYRAFQLVLQKRFSKNWQMLAGYTQSRAEGNVDNQQVDNFGGVTVTANPFINPNNAINYVEASGATFGQPQSWVTPRTYLISGRLSF